LIMALPLIMGLEFFGNAADCLGQNAQVVARMQSSGIVRRVLIVVCRWCREESNSEKRHTKDKDIL